MSDAKAMIAEAKRRHDMMKKCKSQDHHNYTPRGMFGSCLAHDLACEYEKMNAAWEQSLDQLHKHNIKLGSRVAELEQQNETLAAKRCDWHD